MDLAYLCSQLEAHLSQPLPLSHWAAQHHYSPSHLHHQFTAATGLSLHQYLRRRRLTEAARALVFSRTPLMEVAFSTGYQSQQAFSDAFHQVYHLSPARFRSRGFFYPLQLPLPAELLIGPPPQGAGFLRPARNEDLPQWMALTQAAIDGYPCWEPAPYRAALLDAIAARRAWVWQAQEVAGAAALSPTGELAFWAVHPRLRRVDGLGRLFALLRQQVLPRMALSLTTFRSGDNADTGHRSQLLRLGFLPQGMDIDYHYPVQRLVLPPDRPLLL